jgi:hypothetical protein
MAVINTIRNICTIVGIVVATSTAELLMFCNITTCSKMCLFSENSKYIAGILSKIYKILGDLRIPVSIMRIFSSSCSRFNGLRCLILFFPACFWKGQIYSINLFWRDILAMCENKMTDKICCHERH